MLTIKECKNRAGKKAVDWKHVQVHKTMLPRNALTDQGEDFTTFNLNIFSDFLINPNRMVVDRRFHFFTAKREQILLVGKNGRCFLSVCPSPRYFDLQNFRTLYLQKYMCYTCINL